MNKKYLLLLLILVFVISGCATRTRIGMFIPAHHLSNQRSGEEVWLHVTKISTAEFEKALACPEEKHVPYFAGAGALAAMAIGMAVDYVKSELQEEAKNYEASYGAKAWLTTKDFQGISYLSDTYIQNSCLSDVDKSNLKKNFFSVPTDTIVDNSKISNHIRGAGIESNDSDVVILISRWVDESAFQALPPDQEVYQTVINEIEKLTTKSDKLIPAQGSTEPFGGNEGRNFTDAIKGKKLAFAYALSLHPGDPKITNSPFLLKPIWKWQWLSKAKVVDLSPTPSPRALIEIPAIPAALFLHTGSELDYNIRLSIDFLASGKVKENEYLVPQMFSLGLKDAIAGPAKHDLSGSKQYTKYTNPPIIGWMAIPGYPNNDSAGYFSLQLTVNESDPSNVKKTILKGSDYLEANRDDIVNRLNIFK